MFAASKRSSAVFLVTLFSSTRAFSANSCVMAAAPAGYFADSGRATRAIRVDAFGEPSVMVVKDVFLRAPVNDEVLVGIHAAGINPVETYIRSGNYTSGPKPALPYTPGKDGAGIVEAVGPSVTKFKAGDRVYLTGCLSGTYANGAICLENQLHPLPDKVSYSQGAALGTPYSTAYRALFQRGSGRAGESVLISGATGAVGIACLQLARGRGLIVYGTGGTAEGRELVLKNGAHGVFNHYEEGYLDQLMAATGGKGVDIIIENLANVNLGRDLKVLARGGRVMVVGSRGQVSIDPRDTMGKEADIRGVFMNGMTPVEYVETHAALVAGMENGTVTPVVNITYPLAGAPESHVEVITHAKGSHGKIVLDTTL